MKTKLFLALTVLMGVTFTVQAQNSGTSFGILGGVNFYNLTGEDHNGDKLENKLSPGFHLGVNMMIPVATDFYFHPGLLFSGKGAKNTEGSTDVTFKLSYLELPLNFLYRGQLGEGYVLVGFGPYLGYGIGGKVKGGGAEVDVKFKDPEAGTTAVFLKPLDAGANIFVGFELSNKLFFQLNSQLGLLNISQEDDDSILKNTGFGLSVGYRF
jgi:hypothetical protein